MKVDKLLFIEMETSYSSKVNLREKLITRDEEGYRAGWKEAEHGRLECTHYTCMQILSWIFLTRTTDIYQFKCYLEEYNMKYPVYNEKI